MKKIVIFLLNIISVAVICGDTITYSKKEAWSTADAVIKCTVINVYQVDESLYKAVVHVDEINKGVEIDFDKVTSIYFRWVENLHIGLPKLENNFEYQLCLRRRQFLRENRWSIDTLSDVLYRKKFDAANTKKEIDIELVVEGVVNSIEHIDTLLYRANISLDKINKGVIGASEKAVSEKDIYVYFFAGKKIGIEPPTFEIGKKYSITLQRNKILLKNVLSVYANSDIRELE